MIKSYLKSIGDLETILYDKLMLSEIVSVYKETSGQYFCTTYTYEDREFTNYSLQTGQYKIGQVIRHFRSSWQPEFIEQVLHNNKKKKYFREAEKFRLFFRYNGERLELTDVWNDEHGYIGINDWNKYFCTTSYIDSSEFIGNEKITSGFLETHKGCLIRRKDGRKVRI